MTRPSKIAVMCGILITSISLGSARAEDRSAGKKRNTGNNQAALIQSLDELFPSDTQGDVPSEFWDIELANFQDPTPTGAVTPPPPSDTPAPAPPTGAVGGDGGQYLAPTPNGPGPQHGP